MKFPSLFYLGLSVTLCLGSAPNALAKQPLRLIDGGMQGNQHYYIVSCPNSSKASIIQTYNFTPTKMVNEENRDELVKRPQLKRSSSPKPIKVVKVCVEGGNLKEKMCRNATWDLDEAAAVACR